jgi:hypothetical protein
MCPAGYTLLGWLRVSSLVALGGAWACSPGGSPAAEDGAPAVRNPVTPPQSTPPQSTRPSEPSPALSMVGSGDPAASDGFIAPDDQPIVALPPVPRRGLLQKQVSCAEGSTTSVSGTVYIPSGELALYNAMVYVPDAPLRPLSGGASCGCEISGEPIASTLTDADGRFVLENVPVGADIPLVVQVGEWRREFNIGTVEACVDKPIPDQTLRLPSRQSEGDIPKIAVATGLVDALECLVRKLGIAPEEFTHSNRDGRVNLFAGYYGAERFADSMNDGEFFPPAGALWADLPSLQAYDLVLLSCDARPPAEAIDDMDPRSLQAMFEYLNGGGRVFASHYQEKWFQFGPAPFPDVADFVDDDLDDISAQIVTTFPKGQALADWARANGASNEDGEVQILGAERTIARENPDYTQRWLSSEDPQTVQYLSANTPLGAAEQDQCGRFVISDIHVSAGRLNDEGTAYIDDTSDRSTGFPDGCVTNSLSPQEKMLAFMLFDISACVVPDSQAPTAAPVTIR